MTPGVDGLLDIRPPAPPPDDPTPYLMAVAVALAVAALYLAARHLRSPPQRARRRLRALRAAHRDGRVDGRAAAFALAALLRQGLGRARLAADRPPPVPLAGAGPRWEDFLAELTRARYAPADPDPATLARLLAAADRWLRRRP